MPLTRWLLPPLGLAQADARAELVYANTNLSFPPFLTPVFRTFTNACTRAVPDGMGGSVLVPAKFKATMEFVPKPEPGVTGLAVLETPVFRLHSCRSPRRCI